MAGIVHVDHGPEELQELRRHVEDARRPGGRGEDLRGAAQLDDVGVAGDREIAVARREGNGGVGEIRVVEVRHRTVFAQGLERALALFEG